MAKAKARSRRRRVIADAPAAARVSAEVAATEAGVPVIEVPPGGTLEVVVDVGEMVIPYTVAYDGTTVIKSLVNRAERVPVKSGSNMLAWAFAHVVKGWRHSIGYSLNGAPIVVLEQRSEKAKDTDHSVGVALVRA